MTNQNPNYAIESGSGDSVYHAVFIDTNLDTHLVLIVSDTDSVSDLKNKIVQEHPILFPNHGQIKVNAVKVKRRGHFYCLCDSIPVRTAFIGIRKNWFLSIESSSTIGSNLGDPPPPLRVYSEPPNDKDDLRIVPHQTSATNSEVLCTSLHRKHINAVTCQVSPGAISKESNRLEVGAGVANEVNAIGSSSVVIKETNYVEQGAELPNKENDDGIRAQMLEAGGMDVNETSHENVYNTVARQHVGKETAGHIEEAKAAQALLDLTGAGEHKKKKRKRKKSAKTTDAVDQKPVEGFAGGISKIEPLKDINGIEVGDKCEIGDNHTSQDGGQEEDIVAAQAKSGVKHVDGVGLMNGVEVKEGSHIEKYYRKKKTKKRRVSEEKNSRKTESKGSEPASKDFSHTDDMTGNQVGDKFERKGNVSQEEVVIAAHVKSGEDLVETVLLDFTKEKEALDNKQSNTKKKTEGKQGRDVENLLNIETKDLDLASKNLMPAENIIANQVVDICESGADKLCLKDGGKVAVAGHAKSNLEHVDEIGLRDHIKGKESSGNKNVSQEGKKEEMVAGHVKSGVEDVNKTGLMNSIKEKEASNDIQDFKKEKKKKRLRKKSLPNKELKDLDFASKNLLNAEDINSNQVGDKCETKVIIMSGDKEKEKVVLPLVKSGQEHVDGIGSLDHKKEKEASNNNKREVSERCGNINESQEGRGQGIVGGLVKSGAEEMNETRLMDNVKDKETSNNVQDYTKKKTKKKQQHKENLLKKEVKDPDYASKNLLNAENITANKVGDVIMSGGKGMETIIAVPVKSGEENVVETEALDHKNEKATSVIQDHTKKKTKKRHRHEGKNLLDTEAADNDYGQVLESSNHIKETKENKVGTDGAMDKKKKKSRSSKKEDLLHVETTHPVSNSGTSILDSSGVMAKEGKADIADSMSPSIVPRSEIERASIDIDQAHTKANVANAASSLEPSHGGNINGGHSPAVANLDAPSGDFEEKAGHHADVLSGSDQINFRDYFVSGLPEHKVVPSGNSIVAEEIRQAEVNNRLEVKAGENKLEASAIVTSSDLSTSVMSGRTKRKKELNSKEPSAVKSVDLKGFQNMKKGNKQHLEEGRYLLAARKSSNGSNGEIVNRPEHKKSLLDTSNAIFKEDSTGSSEGPHGVENSDASTRTPSDNILSDYSDGDSLEDGNTPKGNGGGNSIKKSHSPGATILTMGTLFRSSSRYKKAKLAASQSQHDDMDSEPPDFVPDSQANI